MVSDVTNHSGENRSEWAPIALFVYNRPDLAKRTLEALARNEGARESDLIIFSDGPKDARDGPDISAVRAIIRTMTGFRKIRIEESPVNRGLADSIIGGVSAIVAEYGRIIVVEDDLVTSPHFLRFMNDALETYADDDRVGSISGYMFPVNHKLPEMFFLRDTSSWGWATWWRAWKDFEPSGEILLAKIRDRGLTRKFDNDGSFPFLQMLKDQTQGKNNSWAIRWRATLFLTGQLTLYPGGSLVYNTGNDGRGTHAAAGDVVFDAPLRGTPVWVTSVPVVANPGVYSALRGFQRRHFGRSLLRRMVRRAKKNLFGRS